MDATKFRKHLISWRSKLLPGNAKNTFEIKIFRCHAIHIFSYSVLILHPLINLLAVVSCLYLRPLRDSSKHSKLERTRACYCKNLLTQKYHSKMSIDAKVFTYG